VSGLILTRQSPAAATAEVVLQDTTVTDLWATLTADDHVALSLVEAARVVSRGHSLDSLLDRLDELGIDALSGRIQTLIVRLARGDTRAVGDFVDALRSIGRGRSTVEDVLGAARLLAQPDTPELTLTIRLHREFFEQRRDQREKICQLLAILARGCDLRIVAGGIEQRRLATEHRADLPGVSEQCSTPPTREAPTEDALDELDYDSREVQLLRDLVDEPSGTRSYHECYGAANVSRGRIRQVIGRLEDLGLVATFEGAGGRYVETLEPGRTLIDRFDREIGRQQALSDCVSATGQSVSDSRVEHAHAREAPQDGRRVQDGLVSVAGMERAIARTARNVPPDGGISLVDHPIEPQKDRREPTYWTDQNGEWVAVGAEADNPLQYWVCVARALASFRTWEYVLDEGAVDDSELQALLEEHREVLRDYRCLGYLGDDVESFADYREAIEDAREELKELTSRLHNGEFDGAESDFRSTITRAALGLAGTMVHLLDVAGVDVHRVVKIPTLPDMKPSRREDLVESLAIGGAIQSRYGEFAAYRQLFEDRQKKREEIPAPRVDADDPVGELIGSITVIAPGVERLQETLVNAFDQPRELHDDAPEFVVDVPVETAASSAVTSVADAVAQDRNLDLKPGAAAVLRAFAGSALDVARALYHLSTEMLRRDIRLDEVRFALAQLPASRIAPDATPTISSVLSALLRSEEPLTQSELAEAAGVSTRSVRRHRERLEAVDLVQQEAGGYRLALPMHSDNERYDDRRPWYSRPNNDRDDYRDATVKGVLFEAAIKLEGDDSASVISALGGVTTLRLPPSVEREIIQLWPWIDGLLGVIRTLAAEEEDSPRVGDVVSFGASINQISIQQSNRGVSV
jgi:DNA-binding IscR family transcriptional regulator